MKQEEFLRCLEHPDRCRQVSNADLQEVLSRYPWFTAARVLLASRNGEIDLELALHLLHRPYPSMLLAKPAANEFDRRSEDEIIEDFLVLTDVRIKAPLREPEQHDISIGSVTEDPDLATEELAEIYRAQGLKVKALETYRKLSLLYPEKSVYFAELIAAVERDPAANEGADRME